MPLYEYRCKACNRIFEKLVPVSSSTAVECPSCGAGETSKLLSLFASQGGGGGEMPGPSGGSCCGGGCGCR